MTKGKLISKTHEIILNMTHDEISYTLGRYCGPSNMILSNKVYGFHLDRETVERALLDRAVEEALLIDEPTQYPDKI